MSGEWKRGTARLLRHRRTKGPATDRPSLNHRATPRLYPVVLRKHTRGYQGSSTGCPTCHGPSKFVRRKDRTFVSLMGTFVLPRRAYYHCTACHRGHCPAEAALGLGASGLTPGAEQLAVLA